MYFQSNKAFIINFEKNKIKWRSLIVNKQSGMMMAMLRDADRLLKRYVLSELVPGGDVGGWFPCFHVVPNSHVLFVSRETNFLRLPQFLNHTFSSNNYTHSSCNSRASSDSWGIINWYGSHVKNFSWFSRLIFFFNSSLILFYYYYLRFFLYKFRN